jgi:single-strand DNA-binding protein
MNNQSLNKATLIGRVGKDPEVNHLDESRSMAKFSVATTESYRDRDGKKVEDTAWHNIVVWNKTAEFAERFLHKGDMVCIVGRIKYKKYLKDNVETPYTEIQCDELIILSSKKAQE